jgi:hypothetical protein
MRTIVHNAIDDFGVTIVNTRVSNILDLTVWIIPNAGFQVGFKYENNLEETYKQDILYVYPKLSEALIDLMERCPFIELSHDDLLVIEQSIEHALMDEMLKLLTMIQSTRLNPSIGVLSYAFREYAAAIEEDKA